MLHGVELLANLSSVQLFPTWHTRSAVVLAGTGGLWAEGRLRGVEQGEEATPLCRLPGGAELLLRRATTLLPALDALRVRGALWWVQAWLVQSRQVDKQRAAPCCQ